MSKYDNNNKSRKYDEDEVQFIREQIGDPSWNPPTTVVEDVREVKIITARLAKKSDGVPQKYLPFKPLFLSKAITREKDIIKRTRTEIGLIFYPLTEYTNIEGKEQIGAESNLPDSLRSLILLVDWELESPELQGCAATYAAIKKHEKKYWNDDIKNGYEDMYSGESEAALKSGDDDQ